jgi:hypothetical protein
MKLSRGAWSGAPASLVDGYRGTFYDLCFDYWRWRLETDPIGVTVEWEVLRLYALPLIGVVRAERLTSELLRGWSAIIVEQLDERTALLARRVVAAVLEAAGADDRRAFAALGLDSPAS